MDGTWGLLEKQRVTARRDDRDDQSISPGRAHKGGYSLFVPTSRLPRRVYQAARW